MVEGRREPERFKGQQWRHILIQCVSTDFVLDLPILVCTVGSYWPTAKAGQLPRICHSMNSSCRNITTSRNFWPTCFPSWECPSVQWCWGCLSLYPKLMIWIVHLGRCPSRIPFLLYTIASTGNHVMRTLCFCSGFAHQVPFLLVLERPEYFPPPVWPPQCVAIMLFERGLGTVQHLLSIVLQSPLSIHRWNPD